MKKLLAICFTTLLSIMISLSLVTPAPTFAASDTKSCKISPVKVNTIEVDNITDLLNAIKPNTKIILKAGNYSINNCNWDKVNNPNAYHVNWSKPEEVGGTEKYMTKKEYNTYVQKTIDGLIISNICNLEIVGSGVDSTKLTTTVAFEDVLTFKDCKNIKVSEIYFGHDVDPEEVCLGNVVNFITCKNVQIDSCILYGCGSIGLYCYKVEDLHVKNSRMNHCSWCFLSLIESRNMSFKNTKFDGSKLDSMLFFHSCINLKFNKCKFKNNIGWYKDGSTAANIINSSNCRMKKCVIKNNTSFKKGSLDKITFDKHCIIKDNSLNVK